MVEIVSIIVPFTKIVIYHFGYGKYGTYSTLINKYCPSLNLLLDDKKMYFLYQLSSEFVARMKRRVKPLISVIICVNT
jgi:hypothetical protein